jgi:hypothetical protein
MSLGTLGNALTCKLVGHLSLALTSRTTPRWWSGFILTFNSQSDWLRHPLSPSLGIKDALLCSLGSFAKCLLQSYVSSLGRTTFLGVQTENIRFVGKWLTSAAIRTLLSHNPLTIRYAFCQILWMWTGRYKFPCTTPCPMFPLTDSARLWAKSTIHEGGILHFSFQICNFILLSRCIIATFFTKPRIHWN